MHESSLPASLTMSKSTAKCTKDRNLTYNGTTNINTPHEFEYTLAVSYRLWPLDDQNQFFQVLSNSLSRNDAIQLKKTLGSHLSKVVD